MEHRNLSRRAFEGDVKERAHENFLSVSESSTRFKSAMRLLNLLLRIKLKEGPCFSVLFRIKLKSPKINHAVGPSKGIDLSSDRKALRKLDSTGPYTTVSNHSKFSNLFLMCNVIENSMVQVLRIQNLDSLSPNRIPPDAPCDCLMVQWVIKGLREFSVLDKNFSFLVSCMPTISILL